MASKRWSRPLLVLVRGVAAGFFVVVLLLVVVLFLHDQKEFQNPWIVDKSQLIVTIELYKSFNSMGGAIAAQHMMVSFHGTSYETARRRMTQRSTILGAGVVNAASATHALEL